MKEKKLTIQIDKPVSFVFEFTTNPKNTPLWLDSIIHEETNEWPIKKGSVYKNKNRLGVWSEYDVTSFEQDKSFTFSQRRSSYHVRYIFTPLSNNCTRLEYYEWVDEGELEEPFTLDILQKLKALMEK